jgi:hypothetical protein
MAPGSSNRSLSSVAEQGMAELEDGVVFCNCKVPARQMTVTKETKSKGKKFWTCGAGAKCSFFQFVDEITSAVSSSRSTIPTKRTHEGVSFAYLFPPSLLRFCDAGSFPKM